MSVRDAQPEIPGGPGSERPLRRCAPEMNGEPEDQPSDDRELHADRDLLHALQRREAPRPSDDEYQHEHGRRQEPCVVRIVQAGQAHAEGAEEVEVVGDGDDERAGENGRGRSLQSLQTSRSGIGSADARDVEPDRAAEEPGHGTEADHHKGRERAVADIEDRTQHEEPAADDRRERRDRRPPEGGVRQSGPEEEAADCNDDPEDQGTQHPRCGT